MKEIILFSHNLLFSDLHYNDNDDDNGIYCNINIFILFY